MDDTYLVELNVCNFKGVQTEAVYTCFKNELCCDEGCCPKTSFNIFRIWYFWITLIGLLFVLSGGCKFCKLNGRQRQVSANSRRARNATRYRRQSPTSALSAISYSRNLDMYFGNPRRNELDELINLRRLLVEQEACSVAIDRYVACQNARTREQFTSLEPPSYNSLQMKTLQVNTCDPPPNYSTVCKDFRANLARNNSNAVPGNGVNQPKPTESGRSGMPGVHAPVTAPPEVQDGNTVNRQETGEN